VSPRARYYFPLKYNSYLVGNSLL